MLIARLLTLHAHKQASHTIRPKTQSATVILNSVYLTGIGLELKQWSLSYNCSENRFTERKQWRFIIAFFNVVTICDTLELLCYVRSLRKP